MKILEVTNLCKTYGKGDTMVKALDNVSFSVEKGVPCYYRAERFGQVNASSYPRRCRCADKRQCCY